MLDGAAADLVKPERNRCDSLHHIVYAHLLSKSTDPTTERYVVGDHVPDAPIATSPVLELDPVRVIDLGCGTGGWSCDMALCVRLDLSCSRLIC